MIVPVAQLNKPKGTQRFVVNMTFAFLHRKISIAVVVEENKFLYALDGLPLFINVRE
jgi:hypothetical protein